MTAHFCEDGSSTDQMTVHLCEDGSSTDQMTVHFCEDGSSTDQMTVHFYEDGSGSDQMTVHFYEDGSGTDQMKVRPVLAGPLSLRMSTIWLCVIYGCDVIRVENTVLKIVIPAIRLKGKTMKQQVSKEGML